MKIKLGVVAVLLSAFYSLSVARPGTTWHRDESFKIKKIRIYDSEENQDIYNRFGFEKSSDTKCGYESCPKPKKQLLNVHIVPHTHDDVGWLKTVDQYYYGEKGLIQKAGVQYIIDSVVQELLRDPKRRFIYVESAFFFKWWDKQTPELQQQVKQLVNEGRLEFIGGAWSMNDEADTHYNSIIDQFSWGLRRLDDTFGNCGRPKIGWQIDPFGHSREQASIFAQMGYDGMFFGRLDFQDKTSRRLNKTMEMIWHGSANLGEEADLFTGVLFNNYSPPPGFCFDVLCADEPIVDDPESPDYNVPERVNAFFSIIRDMSLSYRSQNLIITMGEDFNYQDANMWFKNLDKLIMYANERQINGSDINLIYSTPSCYLKSLYDAELTWPEKSDDFFPYASDPHSFWTGYFTSRPTIKRFERVGNHFLQICKQLTAFSPKWENSFEPHLDYLREAMGILQHHDAVTGTEKQHVAYDYERILQKAIDGCASNVQIAMNQLTTRDTFINKEDELNPGLSPDSPFNFANCNYLNISQCEISEKSTKFIVTLYNPLAHSLYQYVRVPVIEGKYLVKDYRNVEIQHQLVPIVEAVQQLDFRYSKATHEIIFLAPELPPLGYKSFFIERVGKEVDEQVLTKSELVRGPLRVGNKNINLTFDANGLLDSITTNGHTSQLSQNFVFYEGALGNNEIFENRSSGAYIFRPNNSEQIISSKANLELIEGVHVIEVRQKFSNWVSQVVRLYQEDNHVEFEWLVGPIPVEDKIGKEVVSRFTTDIKNDKVFYTDSNGREVLKRRRNHRDTWDLKLDEKVSGNYYPITAKIAIEDDETRLAVLTDRAQGGSSLKDGSVELMIHRRLLHDDAFGVGEALNETGSGKGLIVRGIHYLVIGKQSTTNPSVKARERFLQVNKLLPSWPFFSDASHTDYTNWMKTYTNIFSAISLSLPLNVHLLTFEPWKRNAIDGDSYLIRFEHILEKDDDTDYSKPISFNLEDVFRSFSIWTIKEMTLDGNKLLKEVKRLKFKPDQLTNATNTDKINLQNELRRADYVYNEDEGRNDIMEDSENTTEDARYYGIDYVVKLNPMQIRTYIITLQPQLRIIQN